MEVNVSAAQERDRDDHQNFNELHDELDNNDSDVDDDQFFEDNFSSSPSTNSDGIQFGNQWYAYRGRINVFENGVNHQEVNNIPVQPPLPLQPQPQEEETDFLEMDFEPEVENENEMLHGPNLVINGNHMDDNQLQNNQALENFNNQASTSTVNNIVNHTNNLTSMFDEPCLNFKNTGAKPKVLKQSSSEARFQKSNKQRHGMAVDGDNIFKITGHLSSHGNQESYDSQGAGCSSSFIFPNRERENPSSFFKPFRSPVKSCHNSHKQERQKQHQQNIEKQNESFLFEIEPIRPRNSVTIYTSNCDEKILMDALTSINLNPDREMITNYFKELKQAQDLDLVDYIINRSKLNCNYIRLIELIEKACKKEEDESYSSRRIEINFYPLDFFSTTPEMIDVEIHEIIKRWTPQTDLKPLACIKNKHFYQTNVLGKIVNLIRRFNGNHKPGSVLIFRENETIKIPQFYVSGYITITSLRSYQT